MSTAPDQFTAIAGLAERIVEGSPVIVGVLAIIGAIVWRAWREERRELLGELREEREARARSHEQMMAVADRSTQAVHAVREALTELRHAIKDKSA